MGKRKTNIDTVLIQLMAKCSTDNFKKRCEEIIQEHDLKNNVLKANKKHKELYAVLHLTRCLDSSLRLLLEINSLLETEHSMGDYLKKFTNHRSENIRNLPENMRVRFQSSIVDQRNIYMHSAGTYPNSQKLNDMENTVCFCLQTILLLN